MLFPQSLLSLVEAKLKISELDNYSLNYELVNIGFPHISTFMVKCFLETRLDENSKASYHYFNLVDKESRLYGISDTNSNNTVKSVVVDTDIKDFSCFESFMESVTDKGELDVLVLSEEEANDLIGTPVNEVYRISMDIITPEEKAREFRRKIAESHRNSASLPKDSVEEIGENTENQEENLSTPTDETEVTKTPSEE